MYTVEVTQSSPVARGLLGSPPPTGCPAWKQSLDSQAAVWRYQGKLESLEASFSTRPQALAASRAVERVSNLYHAIVDFQLYSIKCINHTGAYPQSHTAASRAKEDTCSYMYITFSQVRYMYKFQSVPYIWLLQAVAVLFIRLSSECCLSEIVTS